jgi:hypothetical protein
MADGATDATGAEGAWEVAYDDGGNAYYYHTVTGETTWNNPYDTRTLLAGMLRVMQCGGSDCELCVSEPEVTNADWASSDAEYAYAQPGAGWDQQAGWGWSDTSYESPAGSDLCGVSPTLPCGITLRCCYLLLRRCVDCC